MPSLGEENGDATAGGLHGRGRHDSFGFGGSAAPRVVLGYPRAERQYARLIAPPEGRAWSTGGARRRYRRIALAGHPATRAPSRMSLTTADPAPTTTSAPICTPCRAQLPMPMSVRAPIRTLPARDTPGAT